MFSNYNFQFLNTCTKRTVDLGGFKYGFVGCCDGSFFLWDFDFLVIGGGLCSCVYTGWVLRITIFKFFFFHFTTKQILKYDFHKAQV